MSGSTTFDASETTVRQPSKPLSRSSRTPPTSARMSPAASLGVSRQSVSMERLNEALKVREDGDVHPKTALDLLEMGAVLVSATT